MVGVDFVRFDSKKPPIWSMGRSLRRVYDQRVLIRAFISRDFRLQYHGSFLGYLWSILEPLFLTVIFYVVFVMLRDADDPLMPLKIMVGLLIFSAFSSTVQTCTTSIVKNAGLMKQVYFPREVFGFSVAGFQILKVSLSFLIVIPYMALSDLAPTALMFALPFSILGIVLLALGIGFITSILHAHIRDTGQVIGLLLRAMFFISGVFFSAEHIPEEFLEWHLLNPVATYLELGRAAVLGAMGVLEPIHLVRAGLISVVTFSLGLMFFSRNERGTIRVI